MPLNSLKSHQIAHFRLAHNRYHYFVATISVQDFPLFLSTTLNETFFPYLMLSSIKFLLMRYSYSPNIYIFVCVLSFSFILLFFFGFLLITILNMIILEFTCLSRKCENELVRNKRENDCSKRTVSWLDKEQMRILICVNLIEETRSQFFSSFGRILLKRYS